MPCRARAVLCSAVRKVLYIKFNCFRGKDCAKEKGEPAEHLESVVGVMLEAECTSRHADE